MILIGRQGLWPRCLPQKCPIPPAMAELSATRTGQVLKIVEQKDANAQELVVDEVNTGMYCFESKELFAALSSINCDNAQGEYYLTDVIGILVDKGAKVWAVTADDYLETLGVNSRLQLAEAEKIFRRRKLEALLDSGVTIIGSRFDFYRRRSNDRFGHDYLSFYLD